jgi:alanine racemase
MVLGYVDEIFYHDIIENNLCLTLFDESIACSFHRYLESRDITASVSLEIDTGMGRLGFTPSFDMDDFTKRFPRFKISHVMSHFSSSDDDPEYTKLQESIFNAFLGKYKNYGFDTSLYNSAAILNYNNVYPLTRPGILLYDGVMSIHSKIVHVQKLTKGQSVSYNRRFKADRDCWVGVVPIGYADGYSRGLTNKGRMYVSGISCPVLGTVCMDMTMIDVTPIGENAYGREVEVMGTQVTVADIAKMLDTIDYEVLCGVSGRVPRVYE